MISKVSQSSATILVENYCFFAKVSEPNGKFTASHIGQELLFSVLTHREKFRSLVQGCTQWVEDDVVFLCQAKVALPVDWVEFFAPVHH